MLRPLTEQLVAQMPDVDWTQLCENYRLPDNIIRSYRDALPWKLVCRHQLLTTRLMRVCDSYLDWEEVSRHQSLKLNFIRTYYKHIHWNAVFESWNITYDLAYYVIDKLLQPFLTEICVFCLSRPSDVTLAPCRHKCFCRQCIDDYTLRCYNCPLCRSNYIFWTNGKDTKWDLGNYEAVRHLYDDDDEV